MSTCQRLFALADSDIELLDFSVIRYIINRIITKELVKISLEVPLAEAFSTYMRAYSEKSSSSESHFTNAVDRLQYQARQATS